MSYAYVPATPLQAAAVRQACWQAAAELPEHQKALATILLGPRLFLDVLINRLMSRNHNCGKKLLARRLLSNALALVYKQLGMNPAVVVMLALIRNAPMVDTRTMKQGSINVMKKVFLNQRKRVMRVLKRLVEAKGTIRAYQGLAKQIVAAYKGDLKSALVTYKAQLVKTAKLASQ